MSTLRRAGVWVWVAYALYAIHGKGQELALDVNVTDRLRYHAVPVAISSLYHDWPHDYTAIKPLAFQFQGVPGPLEELITWAVAYQQKPEDAVYFWAADDRGMADYVAWAFRLFGPHTSSLYSFYFVVLGISCLLFLLEAGGSAGMNALLLFTLAAVYSAIPVIPLANIHPTVYEPVTLYEPRTIEMLSAIATLHLAFAGFVNAQWTRRRVTLAVGQLLVLMFCYQARSSVGWQVVFIVVAGLGNVAWRRFQRPSWVPVALLLLSLVGLSVYQRVMYHPRYFEDMGSRTVWHNALMGIGGDPIAGPKYKLGVDDRAVIDAVTTFLRERNDPRLDATWDTQNILGSLGSHSDFNWHRYEDAARELYFHIWREHASSLLHTYLVTKPSGILATFHAVAKPDAMAQRNLRQLFFNPVSAGALFLAFPGFVLVCASRPRLLPMVLGMAVLFLFSLIPGLAFYAVPLTMMGSYVALASLLYLTIAMVLSAASHAAARPAE